MSTLQVRDGTLPRVKTFCVGEYDVGTPDETICTRADLEAVVANFKRLSTGPTPLHRPPIAKGHESNGEDLTKRTDQPSWGWVTDCWLEGDYLYTKWEGIPDSAAAQINAGEYRYPSAEFYDDPAKGNLPGEGWCLRRVVMLGAVPPRNKRLGQLVPLAFGENLRFRQVKRYKSHTGIKCFAEGAIMDRAALEDQLRGIGFNDAQIESLKGLPDDAFQAFVLATLAAKAGGEPAAAPAETAAAEPPVMPSPEQMIQDLLAAGVPQAEIDAVKADVNALYALWMEKGQVKMSEPPSTPAPSPTPKQIIHKFAEPAQLVAVKRQLASLQNQAAILFSERERERKATRERTVKELCKKWVDGGYVLPGDVDPKSSTPNVYHRLMNADGGTVKKFAEKSLTDFDAAVAEIESRGPGYVGKFFSEKIADPVKVKNVVEQGLAAIRERYATATGKTLEQRLGMLPPAGMR